MRRIPVIRALILAAALCSPGSPALAQAQQPNGVVLVRVMAKLTAVLNDQLGGTRKTIELPDAMVATGSGFVVSRLGYVVTNYHVVADEQYRGVIRGAPATISLSVQRIEVYFPPDVRSGRAPLTFDASLVTSDPELDLAVLAIPGNELPYVPFGDSDALRVGRAVYAVGYPLGELLEVSNEEGTQMLVPAAASGAVSALRPADDGTTRLIQTSAPLNRGNSGGPLLDAQGFAIGVVQAKMRGAEGIGFAIPINLVKEFLARNGLDTSLPATRVALGHAYDSPEKLIRFSAPIGFDDVANTRLAVDSGATLPGVALHIDRILSPWPIEQVEGALISGSAFERHEAVRFESPVREGRALRGEAKVRGGETGQRMLYSVIDEGPEKIVARYVGSSEQVAFNESVLFASLASIESQKMIGRKPPDGAGPAFSGASSPVLADVVRRIPSGWVLDGGAPVPCAGLKPPSESLVVSPRWDFGTSFRIARYGRASDLEQAAARCGERGSGGGASYQQRLSRFGVEYSVEGRFVTSESGMLQIELVAPTRAFVAARETFTRWTAEVGLDK